MHSKSSKHADVPLLEEKRKISNDVQDDKGEAYDDWNVDFSDNTQIEWKDMTTEEKRMALAATCLKMGLVLGFLFLFVCSLTFLADAFRLVAGKEAGDVFRESEIFNNKISGLMVGILVTVLVQSSSTSTSIVITMVASDLLTVSQAIPIIMGANIGTSVTSTIVALGQVGEKNEFRRAFAAATVHDMFNFLTVMVLLPLEYATSYLEVLSDAIVTSIFGEDPEEGYEEEDLLKKITEPFTAMFCQIDSGLITDIAIEEDPVELERLKNLSFLYPTPTDNDYSREYLFDPARTGFTDVETGICVLIMALAIMCISLAAIVYLLKTLLKGRIAVWIHSAVNEEVSDREITCGSRTFVVPLGWVAGYIALLVGAGVTVLVQSSSITTSALTPLVGIGVFGIERMYPIVLGANIGTTVTGILSALSQDGNKISFALQTAFAHLFFNITGIFIFYTIWPLRSLPINAAKFMGNMTAKYRWFALAYIFGMFLIVPGIFVGLSIAGLVPFLVVLVPSVLILAFVLVVNYMQDNVPHRLPIALQSWEWLPECMQSLEPFDRIFCQNAFTRKCCFSGNKKDEVLLPS